MIAAIPKASWPTRSLLGFTLLGASGCFFTEVVNEAPVAGIRSDQDGPYFIGQTLTFDATKTVDDVTTDLTCDWLALACNEEQEPPCRTIASATGDIRYEFEVPITSHDQIRIQLRVTDELGATRQQPDFLSIDITNRPPEVGLQVTGNKEQSTDLFILYRPIDLVIEPQLIRNGVPTLDADGDEVALEWELFAPPGSSAGARSFEPVGDAGYKLIPDVPGMWKVVLHASDGYDGSDEVEVTLPVGPDAPPCLASVEPLAHPDGHYLVQSSDGPRSFSVLSVVDALDPFPALLDDDSALGEATFQWFIKEPEASGFVAIPGQTSESYSVDPLAYEPGDILELRVEVQDRVRGPERELSCGADARACELVAGSECYQRLAWGVQVQ